MLLIRNARLFTMEGDGCIDGGDVLMDGGKVVGGKMGEYLKRGKCAL